MVLAVSVHHPVLAVGADLQLEVGHVVRLLCLLGDGALRGDACQDFEELEVDLWREMWSSTRQLRSFRHIQELLVQIGESDPRSGFARGWNQERLVTSRGDGVVGVDGCLRLMAVRF